jgi:hypothetical protein
MEKPQCSVQQSVNRQLKLIERGGINLLDINSKWSWDFEQYYKGL